jgi:hypothetical protein
MHIEDLQQLLKSEREGYASLLAIVVPSTSRSEVQIPEQAVADGMKPLRQNLSMAQRRRQAEDREREAHPNATKEYWEGIQAQYDKAGKLPA